MTATEDKLHNYTTKYPALLEKNNISDEWKDLIVEVFSECVDNLEKLNKFLEAIPEDDLLPKRSNIWSFTQYCKPEEVKVVIIGQDPYATRDWPHGLAFSVEKNIKTVPPSLRNVLEEVQSDIKSSKYSKTLKDFRREYGCLEHWARQGVLLLNSVLTVTVNKPRSHGDQGWEEIVAKLVTKIQNIAHKEEKFLIFMLWGNDAMKMEECVDKELGSRVLSAGHPSPLNRLKNFKGCKHFSKANDILTSIGVGAIDWSLTE